MYRKFFIVFITLILYSFFSINYADNFQLDKVQNQAVWENADTVIMHVPGEEVFWIDIMPIASGYNSIFNHQAIIAEFNNLIRQLKKFNVNVIKADDVILSGTIDNSGNTIQDAPLYQLKDFSQNYLNFNMRYLKTPLSFDIDTYKKRILSGFTPKNLLKLIYTNPTVELYQELDYTSADNILSPRFISKPYVNFFYIEDSAISTDKGIVIGKFANPQRHGESVIMKFIFSKLMIEPIYSITGNGTFEGGDYIPAGNVVFLGQGIRTNAEGIRQLLKNNVFSSETIVIVKDNLQIPMQMHLTSYFNILREDLALISEDRISDDKAPKADIYKFDYKNKEYILKQKDTNFLTFIKNNLGYKVLPVSYDDVMNYGTDFILIRRNLPLIPDGVSKDFKNSLEDNGVKAIYTNIGAIKSGGGGIKSVIQVINRKITDNSSQSKRVDEVSGGNL